MKEMKYVVCVVLIALLLVSAGCAKKTEVVNEVSQQPASSTAATAAVPEKKKPRVALIVNQRFGDKGPIDDMGVGADTAIKLYDVEIKRLESPEPAAYEEDVRAIAKEGYDLIITTFPAMSDATKSVAKDYPDTKFAAIYQFINIGGQEKKKNIWDTEYHGETAFYILGALSTKLTKSHKLGIVIGEESPTANAEGNGFMKGVKDNCADCTVDSAFVGSYEDPAKAKEIAKAMISKGIDVLQTDTGRSQLGIIEAAKEAGVLVSGDVADNYEMYKGGFFGFVGISFGQNVVEAVKQLVEGKFPGGEHGIMSVENKGYFVPYDALERFGSANSNYSQGMKEGIELAKTIEKNAASGSLKIEFDTNTPNWKRIN